jgi:phosphatidylglycerophosphate synthase
MRWLQEYKSSIKLIEVEELFDLILYRPLAFLFVKCVYKTDLTPNHITSLGIAIGVIGGFHFSLNNPLANIIGAALLLIYIVLDCSDGMVARLKNNGTFFGRILDGIADYTVGIAVYLGIGFGYASTSNDPLLYWGLLAFVGISNILHSISLDFYRTKYRDYSLNRDLTLGASLAEFEKEFKKLEQCGGNCFSKFVIWVYLKYSAIQLKAYAKKEKQKQYDRDDYLKKNRKIVHLWTYIGPSSTLTLIIISSLLNRFDIFMWGLTIVGNSYAFILFIVQNQINKKTKTLRPTK